MTEEEIKIAITQNTAMQQYFKQFSETVVKDYLSSYIVYKKIWLDHGKRYANDMEEDSIKWVSRAATHLEYIQQKKLFDMQCLWRAEKILIPEIQICYDFCVWEHNILNCPFIEPISGDDIDLYAQYLITCNPEYKEMYYTESWQDHAEIIEAYRTDNENSNFPDWYEFYNSRRGTGVYMTLPDTRGQKEEFYEDMSRQHHGLQQGDPKPYVPPKTISYYNKEQREWFIKTFENKQVQQLYEAFEWNNRNNNLAEELDEYIQTLMNADEPVSMPASYNWQQAIKEAANSYTNKKTAEALPEAWEQYQMNLQMNIAFTNESPYSTCRLAKEIYLGHILNGRKLNGEPEDLNF